MPLKCDKNAGRTESPLFYQMTPQGLIFKIHVQPKSSRNMIAGSHGDALKIKITAPPVHGAANEMCLAFLSKCLNVRKSSLAVISGQNGRTKMIRVQAKGSSSFEGEMKQLKELLISLASGLSKSS
ncbi:MAG: DUF167 domain-containing protein [Pseudomonadota bacterium]